MIKCEKIAIESPDWMKVNNKYLGDLQDFKEPNETARLRKFSNYL